MKVTLKSPIKFADREITVFEFRELRAKDMRSIKLNSMTIGDLLDVAGQLCGEPRPILDLMTPEDTLRVVTLMGNALAPGGSPSGELLQC